MQRLEFQLESISDGNCIGIRLDPPPPGAAVAAWAAIHGRSTRLGGFFPDRFDCELLASVIIIYDAYLMDVERIASDLIAFREAPRARQEIKAVNRWPCRFSIEWPSKFLLIIATIN